MCRLNRFESIGWDAQKKYVIFNWHFQRIMCIRFVSKWINKYYCWQRISLIMIYISVGLRRVAPHDHQSYSVFVTVVCLRMSRHLLKYFFQLLEEFIALYSVWQSPMESCGVEATDVATIAWTITPKGATAIAHTHKSFIAFDSK